MHRIIYVTGIAFVLTLLAQTVASKEASLSEHQTFPKNSSHSEREGKCKSKT